MDDIIVVSDLHLGRGKNTRSGRYYRLEAFFYDDDFEAFCRWLIEEAEARKQGLRLVFNGDTFDLLRIEPRAADGDDHHATPSPTPPRAAEIMRDIVAGHPVWVTGVARVLAAGHRVVFTPGNHDPEIQWSEVQDVVREALRARVAELAGESRATRADDHLVFEPWFHYEPGRVWIEHGCQYDPENSFEYHLRGRVPCDDDAVRQIERDLPMGTFFQRYLYNSFGNITFIVPNSRSNLRYFRWLVLNKPRLLARVARRQLPFFLQIVRRLAKAAGSTDALARCHGAELDRLATGSGLGEDLREIDRLKRVRGSAAVVTRGVILQVLKVVAFVTVITLLGAGLWFTGFYAINEVAGGMGLKTVLFLALNFLFLLAAGVGVVIFLLRVPAGPEAGPPRRAAHAIAARLDVPLVVFGHTHEEVILRLDREESRTSWYFNTGTWIAVFTHDELLPRERVQYTFLRVRGSEGELLHWSPGRKEAVPVVLLEERGADESAHPPDVHAPS